MEFVRNSGPAVHILLQKSTCAPLLCPCPSPNPCTGEASSHDDPDEFIAEITKNPQYACQDIVYQGLPMMVGMIISQTGEYEVENYLAAIESLDQEKISLSYKIAKKQMSSSNNPITIPEEISAIQVADSNFITPMRMHRLRLPTSSMNKYGAIMIYRVVVFQTPKHYLNALISLQVSLEIVSTMSTRLSVVKDVDRNQSSRERLHPQLSIDVTILNPIQVTAVSVEETAACGSIWNISVKNLIKKKPIWIHNLMINLKSTIRLDNRLQGEDDIYDELGDKQYAGSSYAGSSYAGSSARDGQSAISSDSSSDGILFNHAAISTNTAIDSDYMLSSILSSGHGYPIRLPADGVYSFAYALKMKPAAFLKASIDDLAAQYLTPFSLHWSTKFWGSSNPKPSPIGMTVIPSAHRIYWSVGLRNLEYLQVAGKEPLSLMSSSSSSSAPPPIVLSESISLSIKCEAKIGLNLPTEVQLVIANRSSQTLQQLAVVKKAHHDISRSALNATAQYYILKQADPIR
jgi:hypothetical protein